jgi:hypothetical protein
MKTTSAGKHKFPYHQEILFFQQIGFLGTINPFIPQIRCTNRWYEDFRSPALVQESGSFRTTQKVPNKSDFLEKSDFSN